MDKFTLSTDTSCDVLRPELDAARIPWVPLTYTINGSVFEDNFKTEDELKAFYVKLRAGAMPTTSQINIFTHEEFFNKIIADGAKSIVHLSLSGGLSNTVQSAKIAAAEVMEKNDGVKIYVVDTLAATQGHRLLLDAAQKMRDDGEDAEKTFQELENLVPKLFHWIIADDLMHLKRGGRVGGASAHIGSMLKIKPIMVINDKGKIDVVKKAMGMTKAFLQVIEEVKANSKDVKIEKIYVASADAGEKAVEFKTLVEQAFDCPVQIGWIGPIIGSHTGAGTLGLVHFGNARIKAPN